MTLYRDRKQPRLTSFDYATPGAYFITICSHDKQVIFGNVRDGRVVLNTLGQLVDSHWRKLPEHWPHASVDLYVVMPNHLHGILMLESVDETGQAASATTIVGGFKSGVTKEWRLLSQDRMATIWQRGFYDRVIRDEDELRAVQEYIQNNPLRWELDRDNPAWNHAGKADTLPWEKEGLAGGLW